MLCRLIILLMHPFILRVMRRRLGQTIHLTDPSPHPVEEVYRAMVIELRGKSQKEDCRIRLPKKGLPLNDLQRC